MPATRGRRDTTLLEPPPPRPDAPVTAVRQFFCGKKPLTYHGDRYAPGERMPDSVGAMPRLEARVNAGLIVVSYVMPAAAAPVELPADLEPETGDADG